MKKADDPKPKQPAVPSPDNPFTQMKNMLAASVGRIPTQLVVLLVVSLLAAVITGLAMKLDITRSKGDGVFPPLRIEAAAGAKTVESRDLNGMWVHQNENSTITLQFQNGMFELVIRKGSPQSISNDRYFARGSFRTKGNVLSLGQRGDLGKPVTPPGTFFEFLPLDFQSINVEVELNRGKRLMLWTLPRAEIARQSASMMTTMPPDTSKPMTWILEAAP